MPPTLRPWAVLVLILGAVVTGIGFLVTPPEAPLVVRILLKVGPVLALVLGLGLSEVDRSNLAALAGLLFALAGDALLEVANPIAFLVGLGANGLALVGFLVFFVQRDRRLQWPRLVPFVVLIGGVILLLWDRLGVYRWPVLGYEVLYAILLWRALVPVDLPLRWGPPLWGFLGALSICTSDVLLGWGLATPDPSSPLRVPVLLLWWLGLLLLTLGAGHKHQDP